MNALSALNGSTLHSFALHCGFPSGATKALKLAAISHLSWPLQRALNNSKNEPFHVVSVDLGLKNFSYCKAFYLSSKFDLVGWDVVNLHDRFGTKDPLFDRYSALVETEDPKALAKTVLGVISNSVDSKAYMARLAVAVVDEILLTSDFRPHVITIESQRTRSNSNKVTIPNVLLNFSLENMIYAALASRQSRDPKLTDVVVVPMSSNKMVNFWLARFIRKIKLTPLRSKNLRTALLYSWFLDPTLSPFDYSGLVRGLPENFHSFPTNKKMKALAAVLDVKMPPKKVDDLVDCFLYNAAIAKHIQHYQAYVECEPTKEAYTELILEWDRHHCNYLQRFLKQTAIELNPEYLSSVE